MSSPENPTTPPPDPQDRLRHILLLANQTVAGKTVIDELRKRAEEGPIRLTVVCPQNAPRMGNIIYAESRRWAAERRLRRTLDLLHEAGIAARGAVVDPDPVQALADAIHEHQPDEIVISTLPLEKSRWLRGNLVDRARRIAGDVPVHHVVVDLDAPRERNHVLVLANQTLLGEPLLDAIRERAEETPADFTLVAPADTPEVEARLREALKKLEAEGIQATGHLGDPDPVCAAVNCAYDEQVDEIIVSTFPRAASRWLRRDVVGRIRKESKVPVSHVVVEPSEAKAGEEAAAVR